MRVLHAAAEFYPLVRTGGLGDVVAALPPAQRALGLDVRVVLPGYPAVKAALIDPVKVASLGPTMGVEQVDLLRGTAADSGLTLYAVDAPRLYDRPGNPYLGPDGRDWPDNALRFGLFGWVAARLAAGLADPDWQADILHAHDWHAGLAPAYLKFGDAPVRSVFTVHNLAFQGLFPRETLETLLISDSAFQIDGLEFWGQLSFMKAGLIYADRVTTVSPSYAREIATAEFGCGLEGVIARRGDAVSGILNGVDEHHWDPLRDPALAMPFDARQLVRREANRAGLAARFAIAPPAGPLYGVVSRLTPQKGLDLVLEALPAILASGGGLVVLGAGDADLEAGFTAAAVAYPDRVAVTLGYDDALSHAIIGGADAMLVPSRFEPCGLTQLYALRYGAVPLVRRTGGLGDTVIDGETGVVFDDATPAAMAGALDRLAALYQDRPAWRRLQRAGMKRHFAWSDAASGYQMLYQAITPDAPAAGRESPRAKPRSGAAARPRRALPPSGGRAG